MHGCLACEIIRILFKFCIPCHPLFLLWFSNHCSILGVDAKMTSVVEYHFRVHIQYLVYFCLNITSIKRNFDAFWNGGVTILQKQLNLNFSVQIPVPKIIKILWILWKILDYLWEAFFDIGVYYYLHFRTPALSKLENFKV